MRPKGDRSVHGGPVVSRLQFAGPGTIKHGTERLDEPKGRECLVRVHRLGLCATDISLYRGTYRGPHIDPLCFGHEWSGKVEAVGDAVADLRVGDRVVGECLLGCGHCEYCARDRNLCLNVRKFGITVDGAARGAFLLEEDHLHRGGNGVPDDVLALTEPLAVAAQAVARGAAAHDAELQGSRILVLGAGMIGLSCLAVLRLLFDCESVIVEDPVPLRMRHALDLGAMQADGAPDAGFDLVLDTSGSADALSRGLDSLRPSGTLVCVGFVESLAICPRRLTLRGTRIVGSLGGSGQFEAVLEVVERHADLLRPLVTHVFPFGEVETAFAAACDRSEAVKVQLQLAS
jgi:threonine dehydrogenase-like Zn-dependent dehydrogenase